MCTKFDIYVFIKERQNLTCNHPPVNFVNTIYQCYLNQIICLCTINIGSALFNGVFSNTIIFYSHIIFIPSEPFYSLTNSGNAKFIVVDLTPPAPKSSIYLSRGMNTNNYTTEEVFRRCDVFAIN